MRAFTLLEILIIVGIIAILISLSLSLGLDFYRRQQLDTSTQGLIQTLRKAQLKAMSVELDSSFGVYLSNDSYTLFKGPSFSERDSQYDEIFGLPEIINISGLSEVVFLKFGGIPKETPAYCEGTCTACSEFTRPPLCRGQAGCDWVAGRCAGTCTPCGDFEEQSGCENQSGCLWYPAARGGNIILSTDIESRIININEIGRVNLEL